MLDPYKLEALAVVRALGPRPFSDYELESSWSELCENPENSSCWFQFMLVFDKFLQQPQTNGQFPKQTGNSVSNNNHKQAQTNGQEIMNLRRSTAAHFSKRHPPGYFRGVVGAGVVGSVDSASIVRAGGGVRGVGISS